MTEEKKEVKIDAKKVPVLETAYVMKRFIIGKKSIKNFVEIKPPYGHRRKWRKSHTNKIVVGMNKSEHFESPLVLEIINGKFRVIDGWHRIMAIKSWLKKNPDNKISIYAAVYQPMTSNERRKVYRRWNVGITQSTDDFIESYRDDIPIFQKMITELPCTSYGGKDESTGKYKVKFKSFVGGYISAIDKGRFKGGYQGGPQRFIEDVQDSSITDVENIKDFWEIISKAYHIDETENFSNYDCLRTSPFYALFRIWWNNRHKFSKQDLINRFRKTTVLVVIKEWAKLGGRASCIATMIKLIEALNVNYDEPEKLFEQGFI